MSEVATKVITWDDYVRGEPAELEHYEIEDGVVVKLPAPVVLHQIVVGNIYTLLSTAARQGVGVVLTAPCDVVVRREPLRTRQPDLLFILQERITDFQDFLMAERIEVAPDLVVEVLSPSESVTTLLKKLDDYHRIGVREVWLVNLATKTVEVLEWQKDGWNSVGIFGANQTLKSKVLPELNLSVVQIFEGA